MLFLVVKVHVGVGISKVALGSESYTRFPKFD